MAEEEKWLEDIWNSTPVAWLLVLAGMGIALWDGYHPQPVGYAIGILALTAGIMSVRKMGIAEKMCWVALLIAFTLLEVRAISEGEKDARQIRDNQNASFRAIVEDLKGSMALNESHYQNTIGHVDGVAKTTQEVSSLAKKALENVTGGSSYAYLVPENVEGVSGYSANLYNDSDNVLTGITVRIVPILKERPGKDNYYIDRSASQDIAMNSLGPKSHAFVSGGYIVPVKDGVLRTHFVVMIDAQNGETTEDIYLRRSKNGRGFAYMFTVKRKLRPSSQNPTIVKTWPWTEPTPPL